MCIVYILTHVPYITPPHLGGIDQAVTMRGLSLLSAFLLSLRFHGAAGSGSAMPGLEDAMDIQREQLERMHDFLGPRPDNFEKRQKSSPIEFRNPAAKKFFVDGTKIPDGKKIMVPLA